MEATAQQGVGEVRRLHIIYFISRKGRIEHPHLIRVHHLSRNGVRLRGTCSFCMLIFKRLSSGTMDVVPTDLQKLPKHKFLGHD